MKKFLFIYILFTFNIIINAQTRIQMEKSGGVYKVPCSVNGAKMKFIFDTGASNVSLSKQMADFLYENGYLKDSDYKGYATFRIADGSTIKERIVTLRDVTIAGLHVYNVDASISENQNAPLLLGQTAIQKLGTVTITGSTLIIGREIRNSANTSRNKSIDLKTEIKNFRDNRNYNSTISSINKLQGLEVLDEEYMYYLVEAYFYAHQYDNCAQAAQTWISNYADVNDSGFRQSVFIYIELSYSYLNDVVSEIVYEEQEINYTDDLKRKANLYYNLGLSYGKLKMNDKTIECCQKSLHEICKLYGVSAEKVLAGEITIIDEDVANPIGCIATAFGFKYYEEGDKSAYYYYEKYIKIARQMGYKDF